MVITLWKEFGETMTDALERCRAVHTVTEPMTYAGRLDPAASGVVVFLSGDDRYRKDAYLGCDKEYTCDIILGLATDTGDIFGIIEDLAPNTTLPANYTETLQSLIGESANNLPAYSGYRLAGKPLWMHAQDGNVPIVTKHTTIHSIEATATSTISLETLKSDVTELCSKPSLNGFRIDAIQQSWNQARDVSLPVISITTKVSSGTFIRTLAQKFGELCGVPACAYRITRTKVYLPEPNSFQ